MANGFGSLYVGASGLQSSQNALNVVANNLSNVDTKGYVRQQVIFSDKNYTKFQTAAVSDQRTGLGVTIGDIVHARDVFLDKAYRSESGRQAFYAASYDAVSEVETYLQESDGDSFKTALADLYEAFAEFAKDPSDTVNQNLVVQKAGLFVSRSASVYSGLQSYQSTINTKITNDVNRINELGTTIQKLNKNIQAIEASGVETAMDLRDARDSALDELAGLAKIEYSETNDGIVKVKLEGVEFIDETHAYTVGLQRDTITGFVTPYWTQLSDPSNGDYYKTFNTSNVSADNNADIGEIKALLLARGDKVANYMDMEGLSSYQYDNTLANSVMMNAEAELDTLIHSIVTSINDVFCPNKEYGGTTVTGTDKNGNLVTITANTKVLDAEKCSVGSDGELPPTELFTRTGSERYTEVTLADNSKIYVYNEEDPSDTSTCYTIKSLSVNEKLVEEESLLPYKTQSGEVDYKLGAAVAAAWDESKYQINPSDTTPSTYTEFYTKWIGELATVGSVYNTTATSLQNTVDTIESNRQGVIGVSSDEELTNMIKYQNAYNASSRYINVVSEMIDYLLSSL